jgi:glycosyltransferase involved in cell wall biosynthesis
MRIVLTANFSPWSHYSGGGQRSTHNLATALSERGHDVVVVYTKPPWEDVALPDLSYGVSWAALPALRSRRRAPLRFLSPLFVARTVNDLLEAAGPNAIVHPQGEEGACLPRVCLRHGAPLAATPRYPAYPDRLTGTQTTVLDRLGLLFFEPKFLLLGRLLRRSDCICPTSESAATMVQAAYNLPANRFSIVPNGVSSDFLLREPTPYRPEGPIVFFGRIEYSKGVDVLLEALSALAESGIRRRCIIAGRGHAEAAVDRRIATYGLGDLIERPGWLSPDALVELLYDASVAVLPSREESFGNAMAEAMAAGVPVVSTRAGSIPEVVIDGETGRLVPPGDAEALATAIRDVLESPDDARSLGRAGRERVESTFTWPAVARRMERLYDTLLSRS